MKTLSPGATYKKTSDVVPTHCYRNKDSIIIEGTWQECEDARVWHQWPGYYIDTISNI